MKYIRKPEVVDVLKYTGDNLQEIKQFAGVYYHGVKIGDDYNSIVISPSTITVSAFLKNMNRSLETGDYLLKHENGEYEVLFEYEMKEMYIPKDN